MSVPEPRYSKEEHARLGNEWYEQKLRARVENGNHGRFLAIDVDTGEFEVADDLMTASQRLRSRLPNSQTWFIRIGANAVHRFGPQRIGITA